MEAAASSNHLCRPGRYGRQPDRSSANVRCSLLLTTVAGPPRGPGWVRPPRTPAIPGTCRYAGTAAGKALRRLRPRGPAEREGGMTVAASLADFATKTTFGDLPPLAVEHAKIVIASTIASAAM